MKVKTKKRTHILPTGITLNYRKWAWGLERIALDGVSNHLPEDSGGTKIEVRLKQDGKYLSLKEANPTKPVEEIVFEDNGIGYDSELLGLLYSTKPLDSSAVGQFGEGTKLVATAALREGINLEYHSRNWIAVPFAKKKKIGGKEVKRLCFRVSENGYMIQGSKIVFRNPSKELVQEVLMLPEKVLSLSRKYATEKEATEAGEGYAELARVRNSRIIFSGSGNSRIISLGSGKKAIFVKGIKAEDSYSLFSYDLAVSQISPDRRNIDYQTKMYTIKNLLEDCENKDVIARILEEAFRNPRETCLEFRALEQRNAEWSEDRYITTYKKELGEEFSKKILNDKEYFLPKSILLQNKWVTTFKELYGENAVIASVLDTNEDKDAELLGFKPIELHSSISHYLVRLGVQRASDVVGDSEFKWIKPEELTSQERQILQRARDIDEILFEGRPHSPAEVRVYSGRFTKAGREIKSDNGVYIKEPDKEGYIGIRRTQLSDLRDFAETYVHERGHDLTKRGDYDRDFTEFFVQVLARMMAKQIQEDKEKK